VREIIDPGTVPIVPAAVCVQHVVPQRAARPKLEEHHYWSHQIHKISPSNPPKLLIFGESKEEALIYILTEAI
jgi:hypothetical protein